MCVSLGINRIDDWPKLRQEPCLLRNFHIFSFLRLEARRFTTRPVCRSRSGAFSRRFPSPYFAEIGTIVVTGFVCVGLFSSPPVASAPCDELLTTAIAGMPIPTTESVCVLLVISPEAKPSREAMP